MTGRGGVTEGGGSGRGEHAGRGRGAPAGRGGFGEAGRGRGRGAYGDGARGRGRGAYGDGARGRGMGADVRGRGRGGGGRGGRGGRGDSQRPPQDEPEEEEPILNKRTRLHHSSDDEEEEGVRRRKRGQYADQTRSGTVAYKHHRTLTPGEELALLAEKTQEEEAKKQARREERKKQQKKQRKKKKPGAVGSAEGADPLSVRGSAPLSEELRLYVGGLYPSVSAEELERRFASFGPVLRVELIPAKQSALEADRQLSTEKCSSSDVSSGSSSLLSASSSSVGDAAADEHPCRGFAYLTVGPGFALQRCLSILRNSRWRGSTLRIEQAVQSPLDRYRLEREAALANDIADRQEELLGAVHKPQCGVVIDPLVVSSTSAPLCVLADEKPLLHKQFDSKDLKAFEEEIVEEQYSAAHWLASESSEESSESESEMDDEELQRRAMQSSSSSSTEQEVDQQQRRRTQKRKNASSSAVESIRPRVPSYFAMPEHALTVASQLAPSRVENAKRRRAQEEQSSSDEEDIESRRRAFESAQLAEENRKASAVLSSVLALDALNSQGSERSGAGGGGVVSFVSSDEEGGFAAAMPDHAAVAPIGVVSFSSSAEEEAAAEEVGDADTTSVAGVSDRMSPGQSSSAEEHSLQEEEEEQEQESQDEEEEEKEESASEEDEENSDSARQASSSSSDDDDREEQHDNNDDDDEQCKDDDDDDDEEEDDVAMEAHSPVKHARNTVGCSSPSCSSSSSSSSSSSMEEEAEEEATKPSSSDDDEFEVPAAQQPALSSSSSSEDESDAPSTKKIVSSSSASSGSSSSSSDESKHRSKTVSRQPKDKKNMENKKNKKNKKNKNKAKLPEGGDVSEEETGDKVTAADWLLGSDSGESEDGSKNSPENPEDLVRVRKVFQGKKGMEMLGLQRTYGGDDRFRLDERFVASDDEYDEELGVDQAAKSRTEWLNRRLQRERSKALGVDADDFQASYDSENDSPELDSDGEVPVNFKMYQERSEEARRKRRTFQSLDRFDPDDEASVKTYDLGEARRQKEAELAERIAAKQLAKQKREAELEAEKERKRREVLDEERRVKVASDWSAMMTEDPAADQQKDDDWGDWGAPATSASTASVSQEYAGGPAVPEESKVALDSFLSALSNRAVVRRKKPLLVDPSKAALLADSDRGQLREIVSTTDAGLNFFRTQTVSELKQEWVDTRERLTADYKSKHKSAIKRLTKLRKRHQLDTKKSFRVERV